MIETNQYQILVRLLDGRTPLPPLLHAYRLRLGAPRRRLRALPRPRRLPPPRHRPPQHLALLRPRLLPDGQFPSASALLCLRGGKGGFGSLLRGAASNPGQKKTSNFDACRDINGRRLRHVNAERRLEEWKAGAADRQLEKLAEDFIKKKAKEAARSGGRAANVDKYLEKFRKDADSCVNAVVESVRASLGKRKVVPKPRNGADAKKLKIWLGKNKVEDDESDSDSDVDDDEGANAKFIVLDDGNCSNGFNKSEEKIDLGLVSGSHSEGESPGEKSQHSGSEENGNCVQESTELMISSGGERGGFESDSSVEREGGMAVQPTSENGISAPSEEVTKSDEETDVDNTGSATSHLNDPKVPPVEESADGNQSLSEEPLDLTKYSSAAELETLGLEKLKLELQTHGLKCGGTLQERAARLFLLKTTPLEKLPKKLLAKPNAGGK